MDLERQLRWALAPGDPGPEATEAVMARVSAAAWRASRRARRWSSRGLLIGIVVVVAAAATMVAQHMQARAPGTSVQRPERQSLQIAGSAPHQPEHIVRDQLVLNAAITKPEGIIVIAMPLQHETNNSAVRAAVQSHYELLLEQLRRIPGMTIVQPVDVAAVDETRADARLSLTSAMLNGSMMQVKATNATATAAPVQAASVMLVSGRSIPVIPNPDAAAAQDVSAAPAYWGVTLNFETFRNSSGAGNRLGTKTTISYLGSLSADCSRVASSFASCPDSTDFSASIADRLQGFGFQYLKLPPDPALAARLESRLLDTTQDFSTRLLALSGYLQLNVGKSSSRPDESLLRGVNELITSAPGDVQRRQAMEVLSQGGKSQFIPILASLGSFGGDVQVRLEAVNSLGRGYASDPAARSALQQISENDPTQLVRMVARRALGGAVDSGWNQYVLDSIKDSRAGDAERLDPFDYMIQSGLNQEAQQLLAGDQEASGVLVELLQRSAESAKTVVDLARILQLMEPQGRWYTRGFLNESLVRDELQKVAATDPDARRRKIATQVLAAVPR